MSDIEKEFNSFERFLKIYIKGMKVRNITRNYLSRPSERGYNDYTIEEFLILYKLSKMEEMGVISDKKATDIKEILDIKRQVDARTIEEAKREMYEETYRSRDLPELNKLSATINNYLKKYHLTIDDMNFTEMIETSIKKENNEKVKEDSNIRIKRKD